MGYTGEQKREYDRQWMAARRAKGIALLGGKCAKCGSLADLQVDHVVAFKESGRTRSCGGFFWSRKWEIVLAELALCQVLCGPCHKIKTNAEKARGERHGHSVLSSAQVAEIRVRYLAGERQIDLAREFEVDRRHIWALVHRKARVYE